MTVLRSTVDREVSQQKAHESRLMALRERFGKAGVDALLVSRECDIEYFTGFCGHDSWLVVTHGDAVVISDSRYDEQLGPVRQSGVVRVQIGTRHRLHEALAKYVRANSVRMLGIQANHFTVASRAVVAGAVGSGGVARTAQSSVGSAEVVDTAGLVGSLRMYKDDAEIAAIEHAIRINEEALRATLPQITIGMTERELSATLEYEMKSRGGDGAGFTPIVAAGAHGSQPHYETSDAVIEDGSSLLIDWGTTVGGYQSDLTRTFGINSMPEQIVNIYKIVLEAQSAAIDAIRPGEVCAEIDKVARDIITKAGFGEYFGHGLGHGMGKEVHEPPYFNALETGVILEPGVVMTVEPGIYLPGVGGVRIEDNIAVTERGCRVLSSFPKDLNSALLAVS